MATEATKRNDEDADWLPIIWQNIETLRFGVVQVIVHNSKIVQIERTEKFRLDTPPSDGKAVKK